MESDNGINDTCHDGDMPRIEVIGARGQVVDGEELYRSLNGMPGTIAAMDPGMVCGTDHLLSAAMHALRAFERGTNSSSSLGIETVLYASGERQISRALERMSIKGGSEGLAMVLFDADPAEVLDALAMTRDDGVLECGPEKIGSFGIGEEEMRTVPEDQRRDLVLERVAFVEMLKR
jgi:KEOPS complex subunit Cgi121